MNRELVELIVVSSLSAANIAFMVWQSMKRMPSEVRKMDAERSESYSEASESAMMAAKISSELLQARVEELKKERDDYRLYARVLKKQVINLGGTPTPFDTGELNK